MITGTVLEVVKNGKMFNLKMEVDGETKYYGCSFNHPGVASGDYISFSTKPRIWNGKTYHNCDPETIKQLEKPATTSTPTRSVGTATKDDYWTRKEDRDRDVQLEIRYQASRNSAIEFVRLLVEKEAIKLPTKIADKAGVVEGAVNYYTAKFYVETANLVHTDYEPVAEIATQAEDNTNNDD